MTPRSRRLGEDMAALYAKGQTMADIAQQYGYSKIGVRARLLSAGVTLRREPRKQYKPRKDVGFARKGQFKGLLDGPRAEQMAALYRSGETLQAIGDQYNLTRERVRQVLRKAGIESDTGGRAVLSLLRIDAIREKRRERDARLFAMYGLSAEEYDAHVREYGSSTTARTPLRRFQMHRKNAHTRGIAWELTFKEWWALWRESGHWEQCGRGKGYCMARIGDSGPYAVGNVEIITIGQNFSDSYLVHPWHERFANSNANHALRTHCKRGHALDSANVRQSKSGRVCKRCEAMRRAKYLASLQPERMAA